MSTWFKKELGDAIMAAPFLETLKEQFSSIYSAEENSEQAALFVHYDSEGRLHCEVTVYFSPATATLANAVNAEPCKEPYTQGLSLLAGHKKAS